MTKINTDSQNRVIEALKDLLILLEENKAVITYFKIDMAPELLHNVDGYVLLNENISITLSFNKRK